MSKEYRVKLTEAAHCLLETDNLGLNEERGYKVEGDYLVAGKRGLYIARDTFAEYAAGHREVDKPGPAKRTAQAAMRAIDAVCPDLPKDVDHFTPPEED
jgi:hypothetical protein